MSNDATSNSQTPSATGAIRIVCLHPRGAQRFEAEIDANTTGRDVVNGLIEAGFLERAGTEDAYSLELARTHKSLPLSTPVVQSGVTSGDALQVVLAQAAAGLSPAALHDRLAYDYAVISAMRSPILERVAAFADEGAYSRGHVLDDAAARAGRATIYRVDYRMRIHASPAALVDRATMRLDLVAGGDYPYSDPFAQFVSQPVPFSPHVHPSGAVCLGAGWTRARGRMLAAQLIVHVARILNFDEPVTKDGFSHAAVRHARETLGGRPFDPELEYPSLPTEVAYGIAERVGSFRAASRPAPRLVLAASSARGRFARAGGGAS